MGVLDMNADFVSFSSAKKLKEKGYPQRPDNMSCMPYYEYDEVSNYASLCNETVWYRVDETRDNIFAAPAIHKVLKWLREEKNIHIMISTYSHYPHDTHDWGYEIINLQTHTCEHYRCRFNSYEDATLAGIEYVIDNLI